MTQVQSSQGSDRTLNAPGLREISALLTRLNHGDIRYCYWKSDEQLRAALLGETDLDILVCRDDIQPLAGILCQTTFKRCLTDSARTSPGSESYIGLDEQTGRLILLHLHYQLTLGSRYFKGYRLPWERLLLSTRIFRESEGVYVADPHLGLLQFALREALRLGWSSFILASTGRLAFPSRVLREFRRLVARTDPNRLSSLAGPLIGPSAARLLSAIASGPPPTLRTIYQLRRSIEPDVGEHGTYPTLEAAWRRWRWELFIRRATGRRLPQGGVIIALIGVDGSGKSTLVAELARWLEGRVDTTRVYFGGGQGPISPARRVLRRVASLAKRDRPSAGSSARPTGLGHSSSPIRTLGEMLWVLGLAMERRRRAAQARRARNQGRIVLCDRFPQSQQVGSEGPWLGHWMEHRSWAQRAVARRELEAIRYAERLRPDLVIKLNVTSDVALQRKPGQPSGRHANIRMLDQLRFAEKTTVIEIDATRPLDQVLLDVKREVWRNV